MMAHVPTPRRALTFLTLAGGLCCNAQSVMSIEEYRSHGRISELDSLYQSSVQVDSTLAAFRGQEEEFIECYSVFYKELNDYLYAHGFTWEDTTRCFNKLYFRTDGKVDRYLYGFRGSVSAEQQKRFQELATSFLAQYMFPMTNTVPFRQCGPVTFVPDRPH